MSGFSIKRRLVTVVAVAAVMSVLLASCTLFDRYSQLTLAMLMEDGGDTADVTTNPAEITEVACGDDLNCVEAYSTAEANYYRFASRHDAAEYAATIDDGFAVHYIVMDFAGKNNATHAHQQRAMERLASTWQDYDGTFPDR